MYYIVSKHCIVSKHSYLDYLDPCIISPNLKFIAVPLADIINCFVLTGTVPNDMKKSTVKPVFKQGNKTDQT